MKIIVYDTQCADNGDGLQLSAASLYPDSAVIMTRKPVFLPDWGTQFVTQAAVAVRICRLGKHIALRFAHRYWDAVTASLVTSDNDSERNDVLTRAFDGAIAMGQWVEIGIDSRGHIAATVNNAAEQWELPDHALQLSTLIDQAISVTSRYMTIKMGDIIALRIGESRPIHIGDQLNATINEQPVLTTKIK